MKIADYGKAITSYIESPTRKQKELSKMRVDADRVNLADGTPSDDTPPPRKPKQLKDLYERINRTVLAVRSNTIDPQFIVPELEEITREYIADGLISGKEARKFAIDRKDYWDNWIKNNPGQTTPAFDFDNEGKAIELSKEEVIERLNKYDGGRAGFKDGRKPMPSGENLTDAQKAGYARRFNAAKAAKDANFKKLVDSIFETEDFGNFKAKVTDAQMRAAEKAGKVRKGTGVIPAQYIAQFNKAIEAGVDSPEFKEILKITGRSEDEILELNSKRPGGKPTFDVRSKAAEESFPEERKLTESQKTEKQKKIKAKRGDRLQVTTGKAKYLKGSDKFPFHHIMNIGGEIPLTTNDIAIVTKEMNSKLAPYNTKLNDIADGIRKNTKLAFEAAASKNESDSLKYLKRVDQLNTNAEQIVKKAVKELPKEYKQLIGFNKAFPVTDEYGLPIDDKLRVEKVGGVDTKVKGKNLADLTSEEITALKKKISADIEVSERSILKTLGKGAKVVGKVFKPLGYALGTGAVFKANALAEERGLDLKPIDYVFAMESGDAEVALDNARRRVDPEYAAAERAKDLGRLTDDFEEVGQSTFGKYNDQIKNIKLP